eukprot:scaffold106444_cov30-Tisochrysis_lutea.AAC.1
MCRQTGQSPRVAWQELTAALFARWDFCCISAHNPPLLSDRSTRDGRHARLICVISRRVVRALRQPPLLVECRHHERESQTASQSACWRPGWLLRVKCRACAPSDTEAKNTQMPPASCQWRKAPDA